MARNIGDVLDRILEVVPPEAEAFTLQLKSIGESIRYCPPESLGLIWHRLGETMCDYMNGEIPTEPWKYNVYCIYMDIKE